MNVSINNEMIIFIKARERAAPPSASLLRKQLASQGVGHLSNSLIIKTFAFFSDCFLLQIFVNFKGYRANTKAIDEAKAKHKDEREVIEQRPAVRGFI